MTLPQGAIAVAGVVGVKVEDVPAAPPLTSASRVTSESLSVAAAFGITSDVTGGVTYAAELHDAEGSFPSNGRWKGPLLVHGEMRLHAEPLVVVTVGGDVVVHLENSEDRAIHLGVAAAVRLSPMLALYTGAPLPNGPAGQQLTIESSTNTATSLTVPVGLLVHPALPVYGFVETKLAQLSISNSTNRFLFDDFIPVEMGAFYRASDELDVGLTFSDDLQHPGDRYTFGLAARYASH